MPGFRDIYGNKLLKARVIREIAEGRLGHAYIISGEKGIGKKTFAEAVLLEIFCTEKTPEGACGSCPMCKKVLTHNHPDIIYPERAKESSIGVDEVRSRIIDTVSVRPFYGGHKIYVVPDAELMTPGAQNALLKTLEEPPEYVTILLLASDEEALIDTIRSRAAVWRLGPLSDGEMGRFLRETYHTPEELIYPLTVFSRGNIGRVRMLAEDGKFSLWTDSLIHILTDIRSADEASLREETAGLKEMLPEPEEILGLTELIYRDALLIAGSDRTDGLILGDSHPGIRAIAGTLGPESAGDIAGIIMRARKRLKHHVNPDLTMTLFFSDIKEI